jgi:hypothetical protein
VPTVGVLCFGVFFLPVTDLAGAGLNHTGYHRCRLACNSAENSAVKRVRVMIYVDSNDVIRFTKRNSIYALRYNTKPNPSIKKNRDKTVASECPGLLVCFFCIVVGFYIENLVACLVIESAMPMRIYRYHRCVGLYFLVAFAAAQRCAAGHTTCP